MTFSAAIFTHLSHRGQLTSRQKPSHCLELLIPDLTALTPLPAEESDRRLSLPLPGPVRTGAATALPNLKKDEPGLRDKANPAETPGLFGDPLSVPSLFQNIL